METILMPTDFSPAAGNALDYAVELAKFFDAQLILVHAYPIPPTNVDTGFSINLVTAWQDEAVNKLEIIKKELLKKKRKRLSY
jgi:nucleotide-binding universal stress UspA family protein